MPVSPPAATRAFHDDDLLDVGGIVNAVGPGFVPLRATGQHLDRPQASSARAISVTIGRTDGPVRLIPLGEEPALGRRQPLGALQDDSLLDVSGFVNPAGALRDDGLLDIGGLVNPADAGLVRLMAIGQHVDHPEVRSTRAEGVAVERADGLLLVAEADAGLERRRGDLLHRHRRGGPLRGHCGSSPLRMYRGGNPLRRYCRSSPLR